MRKKSKVQPCQDWRYYNSYKKEKYQFIVFLPTCFRMLSKVMVKVFREDNEEVKEVHIPIKYEIHCRLQAEDDLLLEKAMVKISKDLP